MYQYRGHTYEISPIPDAYVADGYFASITSFPLVNGHLVQYEDLTVERLRRKVYEAIDEYLRRASP
jgi:hypothetical protein